MAKLKQQQIEVADAARRGPVLAGLAASGGVCCWCNRCGHRAILPLSRLLAELGPAYPVAELGARLRCAGCGSKDVAARPEGGWSEAARPQGGRAA
ncbi:MAG: hypothetical protein OHK0024_14530 [Thalassobaculales bacterium]